MPCDARTVHDRWGRLCFGGLAGAAVVFAWAVPTHLLLNGPGPYLKSAPFDHTVEYAVGYGLPLGMAVGAAVGFVVRRSVRIRPPLPALMACCFVVWFVGSALTPIYSRVRPPPLHEAIPWAISVSAAALGFAGLPVIWWFHPSPDRQTPHSE